MAKKEMTIQPQIGSMATPGQTTVLEAFWARLLTMRDVAHQRRQLAGLSDAQLKDIGLTRADVVAETARPFWRV